MGLSNSGHGLSQDNNHKHKSIFTCFLPGTVIIITNRSSDLILTTKSWVRSPYYPHVQVKKLKLPENNFTKIPVTKMKAQ